MVRNIFDFQFTNSIRVYIMLNLKKPTILVGTKNKIKLVWLINE